MTKWAFIGKDIFMGIANSESPTQQELITLKQALQEALKTIKKDS